MPELALTMPKMSMTMEEGTMVAWLKGVGDAVRSGEPVCEVTTDKVDMEVESPFDGTLARIVAEPDEVVKIGDPIAYITTDDDDLLGGLFGDDEQTPSSVAAPSAATTTADIAAPDAAAVDAAWPAAVPAARHEAARRGIDLRSVTPTGPWNSIRVTDVDAAVPAPAATPSPRPEPEPMPVPAAAPTPPPSAAAAPASTPPADAAARRRLRLRRQVATVMSRSAAVPQFTAYTDLDLTALSEIRKTDLGGAGWTAVLIRAQALALRAHPDLNRFWADGDLTANDTIGIAMAVDSPTGLVAPVVRDADRLPLRAVAAQIRDLVERARSETLSPDDLGGATTVFSNLGGMGVQRFNALLTPPHATALSAGAVRNVVTAPNPTTFAIRLMCTVGLTVDHRVADGADSARCLSTLHEVLADPAALRG